MDANLYQKLAMRTKADPAKILARLNELGPAYVQAWVASNGLVNENGEIADIIKAAIEYGRGPVNTTHLKEEIGDAIWRLCQLADAFGLTLEECLLSNLNKLQNKMSGRYKSGEFSEEATNNRDLEAERNSLESHVQKSDFADTSKGFEVTEVTPSGFAEPPEALEIEKGGSWLYGQPNEPGDYEWCSTIQGTPTLYLNYSGQTKDWGRNTYYRKVDLKKKTEPIDL